MLILPEFEAQESLMNEKFILTLIDKFSSGSIGELELSDGTYHLVLRKERTESNAGGIESSAGGAESPAGNTVPSTAGIPGGVSGESSVRLGISGKAAFDIASGAQGIGEMITSPIVATFYSAPGPDAPPFVKPGSRVKTGQTLCILEAMKMMNHLEAEFDCEIIETHTLTGDLVEYGQTLFTVKRL